MFYLTYLLLIYKGERENKIELDKYRASNNILNNLHSNLSRVKSISKTDRDSSQSSLNTSSNVPNSFISHIVYKSSKSSKVS